MLVRVLGPVSAALHCFPLFCTVLHCPSLVLTVLHSLALICTYLHLSALFSHCSSLFSTLFTVPHWFFLCTPLDPSALFFTVPHSSSLSPTASLPCPL
jgi:hypothetical protein